METINLIAKQFHQKLGIDISGLQSNFVISGIHVIVGSHQVRILRSRFLLNSWKHEPSVWSLAFCMFRRIVPFRLL